MSERSRKFHPGLPGDKTLALVDLFLFLLDARIPKTSLDLAEPFLRRKKVIYVLTKEDLADLNSTKAWIENLSRVRPTFSVDARSGAGVKGIIRYLKKEHGKVNAKRRQGVLERPLRVMLFGLPNVGKSSLANRLLGYKKAPFGSKPGLTRGSNWLRGRRFLEILDTPGVLDYKQTVGETKMKLASVWSLPDKLYDPSEVFEYLSKVVWKEKDPKDALKDFALKRGALGAGGSLDMEKARRTFINSFRKGEFGRFTLEGYGSVKNPV